MRKWEEAVRRIDRAVTDLAEIEEILKECKTCHLAMVDNGKPYVVPLSYGYKMQEDGSLELYFHGAKEGRKIDILRKQNTVCFEISKEGEPVHAEIPCNSGYFYSSVIGDGKAYFVEDISEKCKALSEMFFQQTGRVVEFQEKQAESVCVFKVVSKEYTGKRKPHE